MKRFLAFWFSLAALAGATGPSFWQQLTPGERQAAGLGQLTDEQKVMLNMLAERYAREGVRQAREQVKEEVQTQVQKEAKAREEAKAGLSSAEKKKGFRTHIVGEFKGWTGTTLFRLENGQVWVQTDKTDHLWIETTVNPEVEIRPSALGGWKLYYLPKGNWVRVRRLE
ncbi:MAG: hypothetical protein PHQ04_11105 [Opitutaceae bacterium]|nr:hypothetical protein [Opitutaceae bacterium]